VAGSVIIEAGATIYVGRTSPFDVTLSALQETYSPWVHDMIVSKIN